MRLGKPKTRPGKVAKKQGLFVYGQLQRDGHPSNVIARGVLKARHDDEGIDGAAKFGQDGILYGQLTKVSMDTLKWLDGLERPQYKRVKVDTSAGPAWAYQYVGDDWEGMPVIPDGNFLKYVRDQDAPGRMFETPDEELPPEVTE